MEELEEEKRRKKSGDGMSTPPSPPTPPSPLPVSFGPGHQHYMFSPAPSLSPPFSPTGSSQSSAENLPFVRRKLSAPPSLASAFSLDSKEVTSQFKKDRSSCLKDLLDWVLQRCCHCLC